MATYLLGMKMRSEQDQQLAGRFTRLFYKVPAFSHLPIALVASRFWLTSLA